MQKPLISGFNIFINGGQRTFRDTQPAAYDAALILKKKTPIADI